MAIVQIHKGEGKQPWIVRYRLSLKGEIINVSEGYFSKWNAKRAAKKNFPACDIYVEDKLIVANGYSE